MTVFAHLEYELLLSKGLEILLNILRKDVIQPQVPLRLPCYDFTPVADYTVVKVFNLCLKVEPTPMV